MTLTDLSVYLALLVAATLSYRTNKLTLTGAIVGGIIGVFIYKGAGLAGLSLLAAFFILGLWATKWQIAKKALIGTAEKNKGRRTTWQVLANGGVAAVLGLMAWQSPTHSALVRIMIAGSLAAATADTLSSELGTIYGRRFFNILTFKNDTRGLDGVISIEGTIIGSIGAMLIAAIYSISQGWTNAFYWITLAGLTGNLMDSILGAALERRGLIGNNLVNFLNTFVGAMVCWLLMGAALN